MVQPRHLAIGVLAVAAVGVLAMIAAPRQTAPGMTPSLRPTAPSLTAPPRPAAAQVDRAAPRDPAPAPAPARSPTATPAPAAADRPFVLRRVLDTGGPIAYGAWFWEDRNVPAGPVLITVEWHVPAERVEAFREAMRVVERIRRRTGARRWGLFQDGEEADLFLEAYVVATWEEHERQRSERFTVRDAELEARAIELTVDGRQPRVRTAISAYR